MPSFFRLAFPLAVVVLLPFVGGCSSAPFFDDSGQQSEKFRDYVEQGGATSDADEGQAVDELAPDMFSPRARKISKNLGF